MDFAVFVLLLTFLADGRGLVAGGKRGPHAKPYWSGAAFKGEMHAGSYEYGFCFLGNRGVDFEKILGTTGTGSRVPCKREYPCLHGTQSGGRGKQRVKDPCTWFKDEKDAYCSIDLETAKTLRGQGQGQGQGQPPVLPSSGPSEPGEQRMQGGQPGEQSAPPAARHARGKLWRVGEGFINGVKPTTADDVFPNGHCRVERVKDEDLGLPPTEGDSGETRNFPCSNHAPVDAELSDPGRCHWRKRDREAFCFVNRATAIRLRAERMGLSGNDMLLVGSYDEERLAELQPTEEEMALVRGWDDPYVGQTVDVSFMKRE